MKIAITAENNAGLESAVAQHFGHAPFFVLVDVQDGQVISVQTITNPFAEAHQPGQIPAFIREQKADVILSGGMGGRALQFFTQEGVQTATGARGTVRQSLDDYLGGRLQAAESCRESVEHGHGHG